MQSRFALLLCIAGAAHAQAQTQTQTQTQTQPQPEMQRGGTFHEPPGYVDPAYLPPARSPAALDEPARDGSPLALRLVLDWPLRHGGAVGFGPQGPHAASPTLQADLRWQPRSDSPWFARVVFYRYLHAGEQQPWNPDYSYSFGYDDWRPGTWSVTYSNYTGTRLHPDPALGQGRLNFPEGTWSVTRRFALPEAWRPALLVGDGDDAACRAAFDWTPRFADVASSTLRRNRTAISAGCRYTRPEGWFAEFNAYAYPQSGKQQPWDPDYTYVFGYSGWRDGSLSIQYGNYSGNRWPGRTRGAGEGTPRSGSVTVAWRIDW
jgi:hypothetical protein